MSDNHRFTRRSLLKTASGMALVSGISAPAIFGERNISLKNCPNSKPWRRSIWKVAAQLGGSFRHPAQKVSRLPSPLQLRQLHIRPISRLKRVPGDIAGYNGAGHPDQV